MKVGKTAEYKYDYEDLVHLGICPDNADVMTGISVPGQLGDFEFYEKRSFSKNIY
ncbi:hypothetical protein HMSSN036_40490 [Paenibacillus macerans]|nr:hypothetical protein HMSSN036_40490 [Paenibacillus macerans]